ncbi:MAG: extracellular solute-binding protein family 3, partial [Solirubrobacteraceae bacterium]|nr:extracellular solute-binding protein family 3 [Solirubrobacteraceae bacterium]
MSPLKIVKIAMPAAALALALGACGSSSSNNASAPSSSTAASPCTKANLALVNAGQLTVATDKPAYPPYFSDDKPENGKGFESAVAFAIGRQLGFAPSQVKWTVEPFNASYSPGPKNFDFDVNEISITPARSKQVDFSSPYYTAAQAVVVPKGSSLSPKSLADLKDASLGVQIGTTSLDAVNQTIKPSKQPQVYNDSNDVVQALKQARIDGVVVDL